MTVTVNLEKQQAIDLYSKMLLIRRFEEESERLYRRGMIRGFLHTYIGEEAIAAGAVPLLRTDDYVISHYRDHGHALARGMDPKTAMAELCGKSTGSSGGKGGSMHLFDAEKHFMGGHAIVGGQLPLAVGMALGIKQKGLDSVVMCFFGDGAVNEGEFHEAMNLASLWKLPVIFCMDGSGIAGEDGPTHHGALDIAYLRCVQDMIVTAPKNGNEFRHLLYTALDINDKPFSIRYPKASSVIFDETGQMELLPIGSWETCRQGKDIAILAVGPMVYTAIEVANKLKESSISVEVVNCRFIKPMAVSYTHLTLPTKA